MTPHIQPFVTLGIMSGTSMDGLDLCLADIDLSGRHLTFNIIDQATMPFPASVKAELRESIEAPAHELARLHHNLGRRYSQMTQEFLQGRDLDLVGCHGQTVAHRDGEYTLQIGTPEYLAADLKVPVVYDFRCADLAVGGNGAPLMPYLDWLLLRDLSSPTLTLNIGGVANVTAVRPGSSQAEVIGFDTGPGMGLIDEAARILFDKELDENGTFSQSGRVDEALLAKLMTSSFIHKKPPKSTGRDEFGSALVENILTENPEVGDKDLLRTLVAFSAKSIAFNIHRFIKFWKEAAVLVVSGGGVHHPILWRDLEVEFPDYRLTTSEEFGINPDFKEAFLMAVMAAAFQQGLPGNMPAVTGARQLVIAGKICQLQPSE